MLNQPALESPPPRAGKFGPFGGQFVPETLMPALAELERTYQELRQEAEFQRELADLLAHYVGRPTPLYHARRLSELLGGAQIYLKREDLAHTGAHKINNALGQALLAKRMGKRRIVAETGAGQHGVASATVAALLNMECVVYMGRVDMERQRPNVQRMRLLGAKVRAVDSGTQTLKDAVNEAIRDWVTNVRDTYYLLGSALGPHPYPTMVRDFQAVIGKEAREQILAQAGRLPEACIACVGGGSNAIGLFYAFLQDLSVRLIGVEAGGHGIESGKHAARFATPSLTPAPSGELAANQAHPSSPPNPRPSVAHFPASKTMQGKGRITLPALQGREGRGGIGNSPSVSSEEMVEGSDVAGRPGVLQGTYTYVLQDADGQIAATHSISAGLDYAAVGPEHAYLRQLGRTEYTWASDEQALNGFKLLARTEGILPALESAHAVAEAARLAPGLAPEKILLVNLSGRGDKDLDIVVRALAEDEHQPALMVP